MTSFAYLEEPWCLLHATVLRALWMQRCAENAGGQPRTPAEMHDRVRREFVDLADARLAQCMALDAKGDPSARHGENNAIDTFHERWISSGLVARMYGQGMKVRAKTGGI